MSKKPSKKNPVFGISSKKQKIIGSWLLSTTTSDATSSSATSTNATATDSSAFPSSNAVFGSTGGKENNVHEKPAAVPTYGRRTSNEDEDREPDTLPTFSSTAGHRTTNASRPSATTALLSPASARVIGEEIKDSDGRVVISLLDSDEDVEDDDDKKPAASVLGHGSCTSSGDTSASSITMSTNSLGEGMSPMVTETMVSSSNTTVASARVIGEEIKADEDVEDDDDKKPAASVLGHGSCTSSGDTSASSNAVGRWTTSTSNASRTPATHMRQALIAPVVLPETKDQLGSNDLLPRDEEQVENALTKVSAMLKLMVLPDKDCCWIHTAYGFILLCILYTKTTMDQAMIAASGVIASCSNNMRTTGAAFVDGRFRRPLTIGTEYNPLTHQLDKPMKKLPIIIVKPGVGAQLEQFFVDQQGNRSTNERWEGVRADGRDTYGREISQNRPMYLYINECQPYIRNQTQYLEVKRDEVAKRTAALVWRSLRGYGLSMFIKHYIKTSGMAKGEPKSAEDDTDIDVEESTEPLTYETMMANLDEDEIVSGTYIHDIIYLQYMFRFTFALLIFFIMYKTPYPSSTAAITMLSSTLSMIIFAQRLLTSLWNIQMVACWIKLWKA